jgi:oxygen-independent coproporphyrinogen-3 oxidase
MRLKDEMVNAICKELRLRKDYLHSEIIESIYFGGGTPSLLNEAELTKIMTTISEHFNLSDHAEITLEANPDDITPLKLKAFYNAGINRLSVGIQSFDPHILKWMNRAHDAQEAMNCLNWIKESDISNYSADLIYGIPTGSNQQLLNDIKQMIAFEPNHISAYCLTIEPKTVFGHKLEKGKLKEVDEELAANQFLMIDETLSEAGYRHYEVSNYCLPGYESFHNNNYWRGVKYLGIGPGAHSFDGSNRQFNISNNPKYIQSIQQGRLPLQEDLLTKNDRINEYLMTSLRTAEGIDTNILLSRFNYNFFDENNSIIESWEAEKLCIRNENGITLTLKGMLLADKLAADLFIVD